MRLRNNKYNIGKMITVLVLGALPHKNIVVVSAPISTVYQTSSKKWI